MPIKTRDLEANIAKLGTEKGIKYSIMQIIEQMSADRQAISNLAEMLNNMADTLLNVTSIAHQQHQAMVDVKKTMGIDDGGDEGAQSRDG